MHTNLSTPARNTGFFEALESRLMLSVCESAQQTIEPLGATSASLAPLTAGSTTLSPTVVDTVTSSGTTKKIYVYNQLAFAYGDSGVQIVSISNPRSPVELANIFTVAQVTSLTVAGTSLYMGQAGGTLLIYNIADPTSPTLQGQMAVPGITTIQGMAFLDNGSGASPKRLYLACLDEGIRVIDVTTPASPSLLGGGGDGTNAMDVAIVGSGTGGWANNALAVIMGNYVKLMDVSDPNAPTTGSYHTYSQPYDLFTDGTKLYISDAVGLHMVDATSFTKPSDRGWVAADPGAQSYFFNVAAAGQVAYFSQVGVGVTIVDTGAKGGPKVIGTYADTSALGIAVYGTILYVANGDTTWDVVDTGIARDLTVSDNDAGIHYIAPNKTFKVNASINNLGNITVQANQHIRITAYLSTDGTLDSSDYQLSPITIINNGMEPLTSLARTLSLKAPSSVPEGFYYIILKLDNGGAADNNLTNNLWISSAATVQVMKGKPAIAMALDAGGDSGVPGDNVTNITPVSFTGTTRADCTVTLKRGSTVLGTTTSAADGSFSFAGVALVSGTNSLSVTSVDKAVNKGTLSQKIILDTAVAASTLTLDRSTDSGKKGDFLTNIPAITLTGKTEKNSTISLRVNGSEVATALASAKGAFSFTNVVLADGANNVTVHITDAAGNILDVTKTIALDQAATVPTLVLSPASDAGTAGDNVTNLNKVVLTGTAEAGAKVYLKVLKNGVYANVTSTTAAADGTFTFAKVTLKSGDNTFGAFTTDLAGNLADVTGLVVTYSTW